MNTAPAAPPPPPSGRKYGGPNGYGHKGELAAQRSCADRQIPHVRHLFAKAGINVSAATPSSFSLRAKGCPLLDQGPTSSCTGHGYAGAIKTTLGQNAATDIPIPSPKCLYTIGREIDRTVDSPGQLTAITDSGADPDSVKVGIFTFGCTAMKGPTSDGRNSDCEPSTINKEEDLTALEAASTFELEGAYGLDPTDPAFVAQARAALCAGYALNFALFVDSAFENWDPSKGPLGKPNTSDPSGGGHDLYCDGYHEDANGNTIFDFANSWGTGWGLAGYGQAGPACYTPSTSDGNVGWSNVVVLKVSPVAGSAPAPTPVTAA